MSRITGANPTSPIEAAAGNTGVKEYDAEAPSITTGGCQTLNMVFYTNKKKANFTPASGTTERYDHPNDSEDQPANMMATYVQSSAGESGTKTAVASDKEEWVTQTIAIRSCLNEDLARPAVADESNGQPVTGNGNYIFKMWPNPSSGNVHFEFRSTDVQISGIRVFDMMGRVVMTLPVGQYHQLFETDLNLTQQPDGMYIIQAISNDEVLHSSTVVLHR